MYTTYQVVSIAQKEEIKSLHLFEKFISCFLFSFTSLVFTHVDVPLVELAPWHPKIKILQINWLSNILSKYSYVLFILLRCHLIWVHKHIWCKHVSVYIKNYKYHTTLKFTQKRADFPLDYNCLTKLFKKIYGFNDSFWGVMHQIMLIM